MIGETLLSRYQITSVLGGGGFSDTYLAQDIALPGAPLCVVKHLCPKEQRPGIYQVAKELFEREATVLYQLGKNDDIPSLYAHFEQNKEFFLVQEYIPGHDISEELIEGCALREGEVLALISAILEPLTVLHQQHFIHRDIKPSNLRRREDDGRIFLIDFGAVKEIRTLTLLPSGETSRTIAIGSPGYMPSEQLAGRPKLASDVYAVGMVGIQALTGHSPQNFEEDPVTGEFLWQHDVTISPLFGDVLRKMIHPYHVNRYANAQEALAAVREVSSFLDSRPILSTAAQTPDDGMTQLIEPVEVARKIPYVFRASQWIAPKRLMLSVGVVAALILGVAYSPLLPWLRSNVAQTRMSRMSPIGAIEQYYQHINERRLNATWNQLTPKKQEEGGGFQAYLEWWNTVDAVYIRDIELQSESVDRAQVKAELWYGMKNGNANREYKSLFHLQWDLTSRTWLIDRVE